MGAGGVLGIKPQYGSTCIDGGSKSFILCPLSFVLYLLSFIFCPLSPFAAVSRTYLPAPVPPPLLIGEAGEQKLPSTLNVKRKQ